MFIPFLFLPAPRAAPDGKDGDPGGKKIFPGNKRRRIVWKKFLNLLSEACEGLRPWSWRVQSEGQQANSDEEPALPKNEVTSLKSLDTCTSEAQLALTLSSSRIQPAISEQTCPHTSLVLPGPRTPRANKTLALCRALRVKEGGGFARQSVKRGACAGVAVAPVITSRGTVSRWARKVFAFC